jgi:hypothetical protein
MFTVTNIDNTCTVPANWHSDTIKDFSTRSIDSLEYIRDDALAAAKAGDGWNPKAGQYWDEYYYASEALLRRRLAA